MRSFIYACAAVANEVESGKQPNRPMSVKAMHELRQRQEDRKRRG